MSEQSWLDEPLDPADLEAVRTAYDSLLERPLPDAAALEQWCLDWSELSSIVGEEAARRRIASTRDTEAAEVRERLIEWIECFAPVIKDLSFRLERRLAEHPNADDLPDEEFAVLLRSVRNDVELFREENLDLEKEESILGREYDEIIGAQTVHFEGAERTMPQLARYQEAPDRDLRRRAWLAMWQRTAEDAGRLEELFERLLDLRRQIAANAGFEGYLEYRFRELERFDYSPEDCRRFHDAIAESAVPIQRRLQRRRAETLGVDVLRPWDLRVDPEGRAPLEPFEEASELVRKARATFHLVDPAFGEEFDLLEREGLLDLESRRGKAPGAYQSFLPRRRLPFLFLNAVGMHQDVATLFHEGGHAFHSMEFRHQRLAGNRGAPMEFAEVASMSMELLASEFLAETFYDDGQARRARRDQLQKVLTLFSWIAVLDAFQHWIYRHPGHDAEARTRAWVELHQRFQPDADWSGVEEYRTILWHRVLHLFQAPFYMLEYAIAQIGALQVWRNYLEDPNQAVAELRHALSLGRTCSLPELFEAAGIRFDFSAEMLGELLAFTEERHEELAA